MNSPKVYFNQVYSIHHNRIKSALDSKARVIRHSIDFKMDRLVKSKFTLTDAIDSMGSPSLEDLCEGRSFYDYESGSQLLRFSASRVSSVCGLHEYSDLIEDFMDHLYQDLRPMLRSDAKLLNMELISKDKELQQTLSKTGTAMSADLQQILNWTKDLTTETSNVQASALRTKVSQLMTQAKAENRLTGDEIAQLQSVFCQEIAKTVGHRNEHLAIRAYEQQTGSQVGGMNDVLYILDFPVQKTAELESNCAEYTDVFRRSQVTLGNPRPPGQAGRKRKSYSQKSAHRDLYFRINGKIDGLVEDFAFSQDNDEEVELEKVVIEIKNRVSAFRSPPPIHDQVGGYLLSLGDSE